MRRTTQDEALALLPGSAVQQLHRHPLRPRKETLMCSSKLLRMINLLEKHRNGARMHKLSACCRNL
jgi:hypothetical protein